VKFYVNILFYERRRLILRKTPEQEMMARLILLRGDITITMDMNSKKFILTSRNIKAYSMDKNNNPKQLKWSILSDTSKEAISNGNSALKRADIIRVWHNRKYKVYKYTNDSFEIV
jgi:hypothetical protein